MDLLKLLRAEHSKKQKDRIVAYVGDDKERFAQLIELFLRGEYRITQRAAWPLSYCVRHHPELISPYYRQLLDNLRRKDIHVAVISNLSADYSEIRGELKIIIEEQWENATPAFRSRARKFLKGTGGQLDN